jgi:hypothetical protein
MSGTSHSVAMGCQCSRQAAPETITFSAQNGSIKQLLNVSHLGLHLAIAQTPESPIRTSGGLSEPVLGGPLPTTSPERCCTLCRFVL